MSVTYSLSWYKATTPTQGQAEQRKHIAKQLFSKGGLWNVENTDFFQKRESGLGAFCDIDSTQLPATLGGEKMYSELFNIISNRAEKAVSSFSSVSWWGFCLLHCSGPSPDEAESIKEENCFKYVGVLRNKQTNKKPTKPAIWLPIHLKIICLTYADNHWDCQKPW